MRAAGWLGERQDAIQQREGFGRAAGLNQNDGLVVQTGDLIGRKRGQL
jgi:hypothetical protein